MASGQVKIFLEKERMTVESLPEVRVLIVNKREPAAFTGAEKLSFLSVRQSQSDLTHQISDITREQKKTEADLW